MICPQFFEVILEIPNELALLFAIKFVLSSANWESVSIGKIMNGKVIGD